MLSGSLATFLHWASRAEEAGECQSPGAEIIAAWGAARLTRACAELAFTQCGRSSTTTDMIGVIHQVRANTVCCHEVITITTRFRCDSISTLHM